MLNWWFYWVRKAFEIEIIYLICYIRTRWNVKMLLTGKGLRRSKNKFAVDFRITIITVLLSYSFSPQIERLEIFNFFIFPINFCLFKWKFDLKISVIRTYLRFICYAFPNTKKMHFWLALILCSCLQL